MAYNDTITREDIGEVLSKPEYVNQIFESAIAQSAFMQLAKRLPNMGKKTSKMPVVDLLPVAFWQSTETSKKQTTNMKWKDKILTAEELAVIVPISEAVIDDADIDIFAQIKPRIGEAIGSKVDGAAFFGTEKPSSAPNAIVTECITKGKVISRAAPPTGLVDLYDWVLSDGGTFSMVEKSGYGVNGSVASVGLKGMMRGCRTTVGMPIFARALDDSYTFSGEKIIFPENGAWEDEVADMISGKWTEMVWSIRQDLTFKLFTEGIIQNADGSIAYNLMQQDMVALRCVFRIAWQIANPVNRLDDSATRYPFAVLTP